MMQFRFVESYRYWWPVTVTVPDPDTPGTFLEQTFQAQFEALDDTEAERLDDELRALTDQRERRRHEKKLLTRVVSGWRDVIGNDGEPVSFEVGFAKAIDHPAFRTGLFRAYGDSMSGGARLGN